MAHYIIKLACAGRLSGEYEGGHTIGEAREEAATFVQEVERERVNGRCEYAQVWICRVTPLGGITYIECVCDRCSLREVAS